MARRKDTYIFAPIEKKKRGFSWIIIFLALIIAIVALCLLISASQNGQVLLRTEKVAVMSLDRVFEKFTILHLSDLDGAPLGKDAEIWRDALNGKRFDCVVMTGDMVGASGESEPMTELIGILRSINSTAPIYFAAGDEDPADIESASTGRPEPIAQWVLDAQKAGAIYLDSPQPIEAGKYKVWLTPEYLYEIDLAGSIDVLTRQKTDMETQGTQYEIEGGASYRALCKRLEAMVRSQEAIKQITKNDLQIAISHVPLTVERVRNLLGWADTEQPFNFRALTLILSGHYTGGQWRLPWGGAVYVPDLGFFPKDDQIIGMQRINSINQHISAGLGASRFNPLPGRLFNPPVATILSYTARIE